MDLGLFRYSLKLETQNLRYEGDDITHCVLFPEYVRSFIYQKQPPEVLCKKKVLLKFFEISQEKNVLESLFNPISANPTKWPNTLKQFVSNLPTNCLSVFGHFVNLAVKGLIKVQTWRSATLLKRDSNTIVFSCEICKIISSTYFEEHLVTTVSDLFKNLHQKLSLMIFLSWKIQVCVIRISEISKTANWLTGFYMMATLAFNWLDFS